MSFPSRSSGEAHAAVVVHKDLICFTLKLTYYPTTHNGIKLSHYGSSASRCTSYGLNFTVGRLFDVKLVSDCYSCWYSYQHTANDNLFLSALDLKTQRFMLHAGDLNLKGHRRSS